MLLTNVEPAPPSGRVKSDCLLALCMGEVLDPYPEVFCAVCHHPLPHLNTF